MLKGRLGLETARVPHADRHGLLWLGRGNLTVEAGTLRFVTAGYADLPAGNYSIPFQMASCILLEPGTTVSHDAFRLLARHGTGLVVTGEGGVRYYASLPHGPDTSARARRHVELWSDPQRRSESTKLLYEWRFGERVEVGDLNALRGLEGIRARRSYQVIAEQYGVKWRGRKYDRENPERADVANQAVNHSATATQAAAMVAVAATGAIPQLGFIHEDSGRAFALDIADVFRDSLVLPVAFQATRRILERNEGPVERVVRRLAGREIRNQRIVVQMIDRIKELLDGNDSPRNSQGA